MNIVLFLLSWIKMNRNTCSWFGPTSLLSRQCTMKRKVPCWELSRMKSTWKKRLAWYRPRTQVQPRMTDWARILNTINLQRRSREAQPSGSGTGRPLWTGHVTALSLAGIVPVNVMTDRRTDGENRVWLTWCPWTATRHSSCWPAWVSGTPGWHRTAPSSSSTTQSII